MSYHQPVYINGWSNLSPQATFSSDISSPLVTATSVFLKAQDLDYKTLLPRPKLRRWNRIDRMGIATALQALKRANTPPLDAILASTAWGSVGATEQFLNTLTTHQERYVLPIDFVQSTHNTVAAQLALLLKNTNYNMTYTQGAISFELALWDAVDLLQQVQHVLVSSADELTEPLCSLLQRLACATIERPMGEGATCFVLGKTPNSSSVARLVGIQIGYRFDEMARRHAVDQLLKTAGYSANDLDLVLTHQPPNVTDRALFAAIPWCTYEPWCGHYLTQTAFGLGLAVAAMAGDSLAQQLLGVYSPLERIGVYKHEGPHWSFVLIDKQGL